MPQLELLFIPILGFPCTFSKFSLLLVGFHQLRLQQQLNSNHNKSHEPVLRIFCGRWCGALCLSVSLCWSFIFRTFYPHTQTHTSTCTHAHTPLAQSDIHNSPAGSIGNRLSLVRASDIRFMRLWEREHVDLSSSPQVVYMYFSTGTGTYKWHGVHLNRWWRISGSRPL